MFFSRSLRFFDHWLSRRSRESSSYEKPKNSFDYSNSRTALAPSTESTFESKSSPASAVAATITNRSSRLSCSPFATRSIDSFSSTSVPMGAAMIRRFSRRPTSTRKSLPARFSYRTTNLCPEPLNHRCPFSSSATLRFSTCDGFKR